MRPGYYPDYSTYADWNADRCGICLPLPTTEFLACGHGVATQPAGAVAQHSGYRG